MAIKRRACGYRNREHGKRSKRPFLHGLSFLSWEAPQGDEHDRISNRAAYQEGSVLGWANRGLATQRPEPGGILPAAWPFPEFAELFCGRDWQKPAGRLLPIPSGLGFRRCSTEASVCLSFERFKRWRLHIPGSVKLWESPGKAGGLPVIIIPLLNTCGANDLFDFE